MEVGKPKLIAGGFILLGALMLIVGVQSALDESVSSVPANNANYSFQSANSSPNSKPKRKVAQTVSRRDSRKSEAVAKANKNRVASQPVVESTPPYPAINGTKWTRAKNGWVLGYADKPKK